MFLLFATELNRIHVNGKITVLCQTNKLSPKRSISKVSNNINCSRQDECQMNLV